MFLPIICFLVFFFLKSIEKETIQVIIKENRNLTKKLLAEQFLLRYLNTGLF